MNAYFLKRELRTQMRNRRAKLTNEQKQQMNGEILRNILSLEAYKNTAILFSYVPLKNEVDTITLIETALKDGKKVAVPRCIEDKPLIEFYYIGDMSELDHGSYGIMEPLSDPEKLCTSLDGFCVLPGLAFDRAGTRLGYGKGYYDRFLQSFNGITAGVCFSTLLSGKPLPTGRFDVPADIVVTDKEIIRVKK
jgi:5-formyltetrahydrofolate cyclo-ligase